VRPYTLKQMQTFIEVARQRSVSKAAERLFVTQPAVSMQIRQLEDAFGLPLIEPHGRNIQLTNAGEAFLTHAIAAMGELKDMEALMAEHVGMKKGRIDLAVVSTAKYFIPMLLVRFNKQFPGIDIQLRIDNRENILGMMARFEIDLVVMGRAPGNMDCEATPFATNPLSIVAAPDHALARRKHLPLNVVMEMPSNETIKQAVMAGMGLSFLSMRTVRHELASGHIALVDIEGMPVMGNWYITHLSSKKLSPAARAFKEFLIEQGGALMDSWS
jgi:DNA-binding transcriptional LysR family regulator